MGVVDISTKDLLVKKSREGLLTCLDTGTLLVTCSDRKQG